MTSKIEIKVAKLYVLLLPFRMITPFLFLKIFLGPMVTYIDFLLHIVGLLMWLQNEGGFFIPSSNRRLYNTIKYSILYLNLSSLIMACVMMILYGYCNEVSPFKGILAQELFYFQYIFIFLYNIRVFSILSYEQIVKTIKKTVRVLLIIAYMQIAVMNGIGVTLYDTIVEIIGGINMSIMLSKLSLTCSEGASAGSLLGIFIIPFVLSRVIHGDNDAKYELLLWIIPIYYTRSSTAMSLFLINLLIFGYLMINRSLIGKKFVRDFMYAGGILVICILILFFSRVITAELLDEIKYILFEKAIDQENGSTISRSVPLILNWGAFTEMPILGVGNGLQGYFFNDYFPKEYLSIIGSDVGDFYDKAQKGIANGGCFWPGYFSGYGIVGLFLLLLIIIAMIKQKRKRQANMGIFNEMFIMGAICFFPCGMQGELYATYYAWFVMSLPFMYYSFAPRSY